MTFFSIFYPRFDFLIENKVNTRAPTIGFSAVCLGANSCLKTSIIISSKLGNCTNPRADCEIQLSARRLSTHQKRFLPLLLPNDTGNYNINFLKYKEVAGRYQSNSSSFYLPASHPYPILYL